MTHGDEIRRWSYCKDGTAVWYKTLLTNIWRKGNFPSWDKPIIYIVDDIYAELRKAYSDDKVIEFNSQTTKEPMWGILPKPDFNRHPQMYRIKPEYKIIFLFEDGLKKTFDRNHKYYGLKEEGKRPVAFKTINFEPKDDELMDIRMVLNPVWKR